MSVRVPSVTLTWNVQSPVWVGVPEIRPVPLLRVRPGGSVPVGFDHVNGELPAPVVVSCLLKGALRVATPRAFDAFSLIRRPWMILKVKSRCAVAGLHHDC